MDLHHLQTFVQVAQQLNFSRAAEALNLSQSAVSRHIEALEQELGLDLFTRGGRGALLTEAGARLLGYAERILHLSFEAGRALAELRDLEFGHLIIGASTTPGHYLLGPVVAAYQDRYPGITVRVEIADSESVWRLLEADRVDVGILAAAGAPAGAAAAAVPTEPCIDDELVLVAAPHHPLAARPAVALADLGQACMLLRERGSNTRRAVEAHLRARQVSPARVTELGSTEAIKRAAAAGGGVAFVSRYAVALEIRSGLLVTLPGPDCRISRRFVLGYARGGRRPPAALAFVALFRHLRSELEAQAGDLRAHDRL